MRPVFPFILCCIAIGIGIGGMASGLWQAFRSLESEHWPVAPATVLSSQMDSYQAKNRRVYYPKISYAYQVAGSNYLGEQFAFGHVEGTPEDIQPMIDEYPVGKNVRVHYSPTNSRVAVLETGLHGGLWVNLLVGALFTAIGSFLLYLVRKGKIPETLLASEPRLWRLTSRVHPRPSVLKSIR